MRRSRQRLQDLGYFNGVALANQPGSAPDKTIVNAKIDEKATGELTIGGGYSTDAGALANIGLRERNIVGSGIDTGINAPSPSGAARSTCRSPIRISSTATSSPAPTCSWCRPTIS